MAVRSVILAVVAIDVGVGMGVASRAEAGVVPEGGLGFGVGCGVEGGMAAEGGVPRVPRRVVKGFDFDERRLGNYESVPAYWAAEHGRGYPRHLGPAFDAAVGHESPPSMVLRLVGGSVAATYEGEGLPVHAGSDYRVTAWVRVRGAVHSRAVVKAFFRDRGGAKIEASERRSALLGGEASHAEWTKVVLDLPGGFAEARWVGLTCALVQPSEWGWRPAGARPIEHQDVHAEAWFDDIVVLRVPRIALDVGRSPAVFGEGESPALCAWVDDPDAGSVESHVRLHDGAGRELWRERLEVRSGARGSGEGADRMEAAARMALPALGPGWYELRAEARGDGVLLASRRAQFVVMGASLRDADTPLSACGVILERLAGETAEAEGRLLRELAVGCVKASIWRADVSEEALLRGDAETDGFVHMLRQLGIRVTGVLAEPPAALAEQYPRGRRGLLDILAGPAALWEPYLSLVVMRHSQTVDAWQIGRDGDMQLVFDPRREAAAARVQAGVESLSGWRPLVTPWHVQYELAGRGVEEAGYSLFIPASVPVRELAAQVAEFRAARAGRLECVLEPAGPEHPRELRLASLAQRMAMARGGGAEVVMVPRPWQDGGGDGSAGLSPAEEFLVVRTLSHAMAGASHTEPLVQTEDLAIWLFARETGRASGERRGYEPAAAWPKGSRDGGGAATLVAWRWGDADPGDAREWTVGDGARFFDALGRELGSGATRPVDHGEAEGSGGRGFGASEGRLRASSLSYLPTVVSGVDGQLMRFQAGIRLERSAICNGQADGSNAVVLTNPWASSLRARVTLHPWSGLAVLPATFEIVIPPGRSVSAPVALRLASNETAGRKSLGVTVALGGDPVREVRTQLPLEVTGDGLRVESLLEVREDRVIVRQRITNETGATLNLRSFVVAPERQRMAQTVRNLAPGASAMQRFVLDGAAALRRRTLRVGVEEIGGPRRNNQILTVEGG